MLLWGACTCSALTSLNHDSLLPAVHCSDKDNFPEPQALPTLTTSGSALSLSCGQPVNLNNQSSTWLVTDAGIITPVALCASGAVSLLHRCADAMAHTSLADTSLSAMAAGLHPTLDFSLLQSSIIH